MLLATYWWYWLSLETKKKEDFQLRDMECIIEGYIPEQSYVDVYKTMVYIQHWLQSEKATYQSVQGLVYFVA